MIAVEEAKKIIAEHSAALPPVVLPLQQAACRVLAEDVYAQTDIPPFNQSSMDGYALSFNEWRLHAPLKIEGEIPAGSRVTIPLPPQKAVRIFTGAPVPPGADTVVMQEKVKIVRGELLILDENLKAGNNVRQQGTEIKSGSLALSKGTVLSPAAIGFLAALGYNEVSVFAHPAITIIVTGKELQQPGQPLSFGQVYDSNSFSLHAALQQKCISSVKIVWVDDNLGQLKSKLDDACSYSDMILLTGGISVGDYDFVLDAVTQCGFTQLFHKVRQRPGKPLYFGKKDNLLLFGLPGNPSSVLTCFYEYVVPALDTMCGNDNGIKKILVPLSKPFKKAPGLTHFLKGLYQDNCVHPLDAQESYRLSSFAIANCLIQIDDEVTECKEGDIVEVHLLPS